MCELVTSFIFTPALSTLDFDHPNMEFGGQNLKLDKEQLKMNYNAKSWELRFASLRMQNELRCELRNEPYLI